MKTLFVRWRKTFACVLLGLAVSSLSTGLARAASAPTVTTAAPAKVLSSSAQLNGTVNPEGGETAAWFEWGPAGFLTNLTTATALGSGTSVSNISEVLYGLVDGRAYEYRAAASNDVGTSFGATLGFTTPYATNGPGGMVCFDGVDDWVSVGTGLYSNILNSFTIEFWVNPTAARTPTVQTNNGVIGTNGQRFAIFPDNGSGYGVAGRANAGISVGTNGITVFERSTNAYFPSVISYTNSFTNWIHVALVYSSRTPTLYVNGSFARSGAASAFGVHPSINIGGGGTNFGWFEGCIDEVRLWDYAASSGQISLNRYRPIHSSPGLVGVWRFNEFSGLASNLVTGATNHGTLLGGVTRAESTAPQGPVAVTIGHSDVTTNGVTLYGSVDPNNYPTTARFLVNAFTPPASFAMTTNVGDGNEPVFFSATLTNLQPGTLYYYQTEAVGGVLAEGNILSFITDPLPPNVALSNINSLTITSVTLYGGVRLNGLETTAWFAWGTTPTELTNVHGLSTLFVTPPGGGFPNPHFPFFEALTGLTPGLAHYYRLLATNALGGATSSLSSFTTPLFTSSHTLIGRRLGDLGWADLNHDGELDLAATGIDSGGGPRGEVFTNLAGGTSASFPLAAAGNSALAWGDMNNDGRADLMVNGYTNTSGGTRLQTLFYRNSATGLTTNVVLATNYHTMNGSLAWCDFNLDGRPDLLVTGTNASNYVTAVLRNISGAAFLPLSIAGLPALHFSAGAWADYNNDGWPDFVIAGSDGTNPVTQLWRNTGAGFTNSGHVLTALERASVAWGDFDRDGLLDLALSGRNSGLTNVTELWRNTGTNFEAVALPFKGGAGQVAWGDFDNDGWLDLAATGGGSTDVGRNTGTNFVLLNSAQAAFDKLNDSAVAWGDYDNDGRLDLAFAGLDTGGAHRFRIWRNHTPVTNTPPTAPTNLRATVVSAFSLRLEWDAASDAQTPAASLAYNVSVKTVPGGSNVVSGLSLTNGFRLVAEKGNLPHRLFYILTNIILATNLEFCVQAVDDALAGGPFACSVVLGAADVTTLAATDISSNSVTLNAHVNPGNQLTTAWFQYGTNTSYGTLTLLTNLPSVGSNLLVSLPVADLVLGTEYHYRVVASNLAGVRVGLNMTFTPSRPPDAFTQPPDSFGTNFFATVHGLVNPGGIATTVYFEWGLTTGYGNFTGPLSAGNGTNSVALNSLLSGLSLGAQYHYRVVASNALGVVTGPDQTFGVNLLPGDLNFDGVVDLEELNLIIQYYRGLLP